MEYLVHIEVCWPPDGDPDEFSRLVAAERARANRLVAEGKLRRLWRVPGRRANWGIWVAEDATALHETLATLPFFPWLDVVVHALAAHPSDPGSG